MLTCNNSLRIPFNRYQVLEVESPEKETDPVERDVLIIGDGNFTFTEALVHRRMNGVGRKTSRKEREFPQRVLATEYKSRKDCYNMPGAKARITSLEALGVQFEFGVDAAKLNTTYPGKTFRRIQWNCPDVDGGFCDDDPALRNLIPTFVESAAPLQEPGGRIHFSLISPSSNWKVWQAMHYRITSIEGSGYTLHAIRESGHERYQYETEDGTLIRWFHQKTKGDRTIEAFYEGVEELVFEKSKNSTSTTPRHMIRQLSGFRNDFEEFGYSRKVQRTDHYYSMPRDEPLSSDSESEGLPSPSLTTSVSLGTLFESTDELEIPGK